jgi:hypothetical protein
MGAGNDIGVALAGELTHDGGAYHTAVSSYVYFGFLFHVHSVMRHWRVESLRGGFVPIGKFMRRWRVELLS